MRAADEWFLTAWLRKWNQKINERYWRDLQDIAQIEIQREIQRARYANESFKDKKLREFEGILRKDHADIKNGVQRTKTLKSALDALKTKVEDNQIKQGRDRIACYEARRDTATRMDHLERRLTALEGRRRFRK